jgi:hypothetical protein
VVFLTESLQQLLKYRLRRMNVFILFASTIFARFRDTI